MLVFSDDGVIVEVIVIRRSTLPQSCKTLNDQSSSGKHLNPPESLAMK